MAQTFKEMRTLLQKMAAVFTTGKTKKSRLRVTFELNKAGIEPALPKDHCLLETALIQRHVQFNYSSASFERRRTSRHDCLLVSIKLLFWSDRLNLGCSRQPRLFFDRHESKMFIDTLNEKYPKLFYKVKFFKRCREKNVHKKLKWHKLCFLEGVKCRN